MPHENSVKTPFSIQNWLQVAALYEAHYHVWDAAKYS